MYTLWLPFSLIFEHLYTTVAEHVWFTCNLEYIYKQVLDTETADTYTYDKNVQIKPPRSPSQTRTKLRFVCYV